MPPTPPTPSTRPIISPSIPIMPPPIPPTPNKPVIQEVPNPLLVNKASVSASTPSPTIQITIPEINPSRKRLIVISTSIAIFLVVFGLGIGVFFWIRSNAGPVATATPTPSMQESSTPSLSPSPETSVIYPSAVAIFDGTVLIEYKSGDNLNQVLASKIPLIAQEGKAIRILLRQMDYVEGPRFTYLNNILKTMNVQVNSELLALMTNPGDLFVYEDGGNYRLGFVSSLSVLESYASLSKGLKTIEGGFLSDFAPMFLSTNFQTPALKKFEINANLSPNFVNRYINLVNLPQNNLSLDYAINKSATLFILATSKNSMSHVIDLIEGKK